MSDPTPDRLAPPPRRPAPDALRQRIADELEGERDRRGRLRFVPVVALAAAATVVAVTALGASMGSRPTTAEPAGTASPATTSAPASPSDPSTAASASPAGSTGLDLDARVLSDAQIASIWKDCRALIGKKARGWPAPEPLYAKQERWAGLTGPGTNESRLLIVNVPGIGMQECLAEASGSSEDIGGDEPTAKVPVRQLDSGDYTSECNPESTATEQVRVLFRVASSVALGRVRLIDDGRHGPWQTSAAMGGFVNINLGLLGKDTYRAGVTAEFEFFDREGRRVEIQPAGPKGTATTMSLTQEIETCGDLVPRNGPTPEVNDPPKNPDVGQDMCTALAVRADQLTKAGRAGWTSMLQVSVDQGWGGVFAKDGRRFACSLAPTREVSAVVADKRSLARSSFFFAVNPIAATDGASFWAAGRVPADVTAITYVLPGGVEVPAALGEDGHWMAMYAVNGRDLDVGDVADWKPVQVLIVRTGDETPIRYEIPFDDETMCNQVSHGC